MDNLIQLVDNVLHKWQQAQALLESDEPRFASGIVEQEMRNRIAGDIVRAHGLGISLV